MRDSHLAVRDEDLAELAAQLNAYHGAAGRVVCGFAEVTRSGRHPDRHQINALLASLTELRQALDRAVAAALLLDHESGDGD